MTLSGQSNDEQSLHVLIVDDNQASAVTTGWLLETLGHTSATAASAVEAVRQARARVPDIALVDIGLPDVNGFDLCRQLRTFDELAGTVLVAHSGYGQHEHRQKAADVGCSHFLLKPFELQDLQDILREVAAGKARALGQSVPRQ